MNYIFFLPLLLGSLLSHPFIISSPESIPGLDNSLVIDLATKLDNTKYSEFSYSVLSDNGTAYGEGEVLGSTISIFAPKLKEKDYVYLQIQHKKTGEKFYTNKITIYSRDYNKRYLERLHNSIIKKIPESSSISQTTQSEVLQSEVGVFSLSNSGYIYVGVVLLITAFLVAVYIKSKPLH